MDSTGIILTGCRVQGLRISAPRVGNQMKKNIENEMETAA